MTVVGYSPFPCYVCSAPTRVGPRLNTYDMNYDLELDPQMAEILDAMEVDQEKLEKALQNAEPLPTFMDFRVDYAFKYILGHKRILMKLLNDILPITVAEIEYRPNEIPVTSEKEKRSVFDVICHVEGTGESVIVEMQQIEDSDMDDRLIFYGSSLVTKQVERGHKAYALRPVYVVCVTDYDREHRSSTEPGRILFNYRLREPELGENWTDRLNYYFLELPRLHRAWEKLDTNVERWCYLFRNLSTFVNVPENTNGFDDVFTIARTGELKDKQLYSYMMSMVTEYEKRVISQYWLEKGQKEGQEQGIAQGIRKVAMSMLQNGYSVEETVKVSGLSADVVESLQQTI